MINYRVGLDEMAFCPSIQTLINTWHAIYVTSAMIHVFISLDWFSSNHLPFPSTTNSKTLNLLLSGYLSQHPSSFMWHILFKILVHLSSILILTFNNPKYMSMFYLNIFRCLRAWCPTTSCHNLIYYNQLNTELTVSFPFTNCPNSCISFVTNSRVCLSFSFTVLC